MLFDESKLLEHFDNDQEMIQELVLVLNESYPETMSKLKEAMDAEDFSNMELHAHTLKGMLSNFFAEELKEKAFELEKMGREKTLEGSKEPFNFLDRKLPELTKELRGFRE